MKKTWLIPILLFLFTWNARAELKVTPQLVGFHEPCPCSCIRIVVFNPGDQKLSYRIELAGGGMTNRINLRGQEIAPGEEKIHNMALPLLKAPLITVEDSAGDRTNTGMSWNPKLFLNLCELEAWASEKQIKDFSDAYKLVRGNIVTQLEPVSLPENWLCYTPFRAVFVRESVFNRMPPSEKRALTSWVEAGGWLTVYHSSRSDTEKQMMGTIRYQSYNPLASPRIENDWRSSLEQWQKFYRSNVDRNRFPYITKTRGGRLGGFLLATLFLILAGPVNYNYFRKRKKIRMLLVSLPVISIAFCLLIVAYFFATQGFAKKGGSFSVTLLDEAKNDAFTFSRHSIYSGLYPVGGFRFSSNTLFYPLQTSSGYSFDLTRDQHLESGLFNPSTNFHFFTAMPFQTRERLVYDPGDNTVTNGFETAVKDVFIRDGARILTAAELLPGEKKKLEQSTEKEIMPAFVDTLEKEEKVYYKSYMIEFATGWISRNQLDYIFRFDGKTSSIQSGTSIRGRGCHILVGKR